MKTSIYQCPAKRTVITGRHPGLSRSRQGVYATICPHGTMTGVSPTINCPHYRSRQSVIAKHALFLFHFHAKICV